MILNCTRGFYKIEFLILLLMIINSIKLKLLKLKLVSKEMNKLIVLKK